MTIEVYSVKGSTANLLRTKLQEALDANKINCSICLINSVDRFIEAGLSSVPALRIGNKIIENLTETELDEIIRKAVDFILEEEKHE